jgi:hypothetical protein
MVRFSFIIVNSLHKGDNEDDDDDNDNDNNKSVIQKEIVIFSLKAT